MVAATRGAPGGGKIICQCGCGRPVLRRGARYFRGHKPKNPLCPQCGQPKQDSVSDFCSVPCQYESRLHPLRSPTGLLLRFEGQRKAQRLSISQVAAQAGVKVSTLHEWRRWPRRMVKMPDLERVAAWLNVTIHEALTLQGGNAEDKIARRASEALQSWWERPENKGRRSARTTAEGTKRTDEQKARYQAARRQYLEGSPDAKDALASRFRDHATSFEGRCVRSLHNYLRHTPQPTETQAREWAKACAGRLGEPTEGVLKAWKRTLRRRGIVLRIPPPAKEGRAWTVAGSKVETIRQLRRDGWTRQQIIEEGKRRDLQNGEGWLPNYVDQTLSKARRRNTLQS